MKLLVTGGAGFIGSNFVLYWLEKHPNDTIVNLDSLTYAGNLENLVSIKDNKNHMFIKGDITVSETVAKAMRGIDTVVHFAAESHVDRSITDAAPFLKTNVSGTHVLLAEAVKQKVKRFHHISTDEVYGSLALESKEKFSETTPYDPRSPYAASKASSDHLVRAFHHTHSLPITITNCSNNYGPFQFPEKLIPLAITNVLEGKKIPVYGDGRYVRDWLHVIDHCRAIERVLEDGEIGETYCVGGLTEDISNMEVVQKIVTALDTNDSVIEYVTDRPGHDRRYAIDWSKIKTDLGWEPEHNFDTYLADTIKWYTENKKWWKHVKSGEYKKYYKEQYGDKV